MSEKWYIIHAYSGFEDKVAGAIQEQARLQELEHDIVEVIVPKEEVIEVKRGQKKKLEKTMMAGYVLAKLNMSDEAFHLIKNTPKVTGFLGAGGKPLPISEDEANRMRNVVEDGSARPRPQIVYEIGEEVRVIDGPFASFSGLVEEVDEEKERLKVSVSIFGRPTPVELEYSQVEKN
ncbi:MAG: transcription termination/antitermination protein NusG [Pseudomonadota bacterium]